MGSKNIKKRATIPNVTTEKKKNYPIFCFRYIHKDCEFSVLDKEVVHTIVNKFLMFSKWDWGYIKTLPKENGMEKIPSRQLKKSLPLNFIDLEYVSAVRSSQGARIIGTINETGIFHVLFLDPNHNIY